MFYGAITVGILITSLFGFFMDPETMAHNSIYFLYFPGIISIIRIILLALVFRIETPVFILEKYSQKQGDEVDPAFSKYDQS